MNSVILIGRLARDPELKHISPDYDVIRFTVAVQRKYTSKTEREADFINCTAWNGSARFIDKYFGKGDSICVTGELRNERYTDKTGQEKYTTFVNVHDVYFTGSSMKK